MLYEYQCNGCGEKFEAWKTSQTRIWAICPKCGKEASKVFSAPNITYTWVLDGLTHDEPRRWHEPYIL